MTVPENYEELEQQARELRGAQRQNSCVSGCGGAEVCLVAAAP